MVSCSDFPRVEKVTDQGQIFKNLISRQKQR